MITNIENMIPITGVYIEVSVDQKERYYMNQQCFEFNVENIQG